MIQTLDRRKANAIWSRWRTEAILITGANRGLGFEFSSQYLANGWRENSKQRPAPASLTNGNVFAFTRK
jgi:hypothetical protein